MIAAIIPAAGLSTRMGRPKLALPLGVSTVLECVIQTVRESGVNLTVVILGPHTAELQAIARSAGAVVRSLAHDTPDMRGTVVAGLNWVEEHHRPSARDAFLLAPADMPEIKSTTICRLVSEYKRNSAKRIVVPVFECRRGHPILIGWSHVAGIRVMPAGQGIDAYLRVHAAQITELPVDDAGVLRDLDTPADYDRLLKPSPE